MKDIEKNNEAFKAISLVSRRIAELEAESERIKAENSKLRELVRFVMHQCNDGNPRCDGCIDLNGGECVALQRMREAGIEVNW